MTGLLFFILFIIGFIEMLCVGNMSSGPFTSGFVAYKKIFSITFEKAHNLKTKKLKERLDRNLDWMAYHEYELRRLNVLEIIFIERQFQFLAHSGPQILHGHIILDPKNNKFTIIGRLSKTFLLLIPVSGYAFASKADSTLEAIGIFILVIIAFAILIKYSNFVIRNN